MALTEIKFHKVTALPTTLEANAFYLVLNSGYAETYVTDASAVAKMVGNSNMINTLADSRITPAITTALSRMNTIEIAADITARNALSSLDRNFIVLVTNATGDATVKAGAAMYAFNNTTNVFTKISEYESMDLSMDWSTIVNKPNSSVSAIDAAVSNSHTHVNKSLLDGFSLVGETVKHSGVAINNAWASSNW